MPVQISRLVSQKLRFYTFLSIALLLAVHGYNLHQTYLQPFITVQEPLTFASFFEYFMANGNPRKGFLSTCSGQDNIFMRLIYPVPRPIFESVKEK